MKITEILERLNDIADLASTIESETIGDDSNIKSLVSDLETLWADIDSARYNGGIENW